MIDFKQFISAIEQIAEEKGIAKDKVLETIEMAIAAAYKKDYGERGQNIRVKLDEKTGQAKFFQVMLVVDEGMILSEEEITQLDKEKATKKKTETPAQDKEKSKEEKEETKKEKSQKETGLLEEDTDVDSENAGERKIRFNPKRHMMLAEAKKIKKDIAVGEELLINLEPKEDYGRIAAQTAKQVVIQRIREAEREATFETFKEKEGEIVSGIVQRIERGAVYLDIGRTMGVLFPDEQIPQERYRAGQRIRVYVARVDKDQRGPVIILSRRHPKTISKLFELEVPEVASGVVEIKTIAREAGSRSKVAVSSNDTNIDPVGSCVGQKGIRVTAVINELGGENIDIIPWSQDEAKFISNALSPAKVLNVELDEATRSATVEVAEDQLSLAIGKRGQNVRLAAKLTGWKIDIKGGDKVLAEGGVLEEDKEEIKPAVEAGNVGSAKDENVAPAGESKNKKNK